MRVWSRLLPRAAQWRTMLSLCWSCLVFVIEGSTDTACLNKAIWSSKEFKNENWVCRFHYSCKLESGMKPCAACTNISPATDNPQKHLGLIWGVFINGNSGEICSLARFVWLSAICRNVYNSAAEMERGGGGFVSQCPRPTTSLKMHPVSVWVPKVTNRSSGEIWPK